MRAKKTTGIWISTILLSIAFSAIKSGSTNASAWRIFENSQEFDRDFTHTDFIKQGIKKVTADETTSKPARHYLLASDDKTKINGDVHWREGNTNQAILAWKLEAKDHKLTEDFQSEIETRLKIVRGYIILGQFYPAISESEKIIALKPSDSRTLALTRRRLGNAYSGIGKYNKAISSYQKSLKQEKSLYTTNNLVEVLLKKEKYNSFIAAQARQTNLEGSRSNRVEYRDRLEQDRETATEYAKQALIIGEKTDDIAAVRALTNWSNISGRSLSRQQLNKGKRILDRLPASREKGFTILNWTDLDRDRQADWLFKALDTAEALDDDYLKSYVLLQLGYIEERLGNLDKAIDYAQQAQLLGQSEFAHDSLFRAQQLSGRIYQNRGNSSAAINAYQNAIASIDLLRRDSVTISIEQRINFGTEIEPIYRSALKLLLSRSKTEKENLNEAMAIFDKLRLAQLQNYFGDNCFEIREDASAKNNSWDKNTASINSIILDDRVVFILQLSDGRLIKSETKIAKSELVELANQWNKELNDRTTFEFRSKSRLFYDLVIRSFESELKADDPDVLVFVHDGVLRNLPMAAMYDGEEFLAQKWASVSSLGLNLTPTLVGQKRKETEVAAFGLQTSVLGWPPLRKVPSEIENVVNITGGKKFLNDDFTIDNLSRQLDEQEYSVVHLATHGYFGGTVENSFILAYKQKISAFELEDILIESKQVPNLLVLSACETALLNERSLLGLAGIAARSGVSTTLGTLWQVQDDEQSETIEAFYRYLQNPKYNKATALQKVQIEEIEKFVDAHPQRWAALTLIGDYR